MVDWGNVAIACVYKLVMRLTYKRQSATSVSCPPESTCGGSETDPIKDKDAI